MNIWHSILTEQENKVKTVIPHRLARADCVFEGETAKFTLEAKRYENFFHVSNLLVFEKERFIYWADYVNRSIYEYAERGFFKRLYKDILKREIFEKAELSFAPIVFDSKFEEVETKVTEAFCSIPQVLKIYSLQYTDTAFHFQILTDNTQYDRKLMRKMLKIEYEIGHYYKDIALSFGFIPKVYDSEEDIIPGEATQIYAKNILDIKNELIASTSTTSAPQQTIGKIFIPVPSTI